MSLESDDRRANLAEQQHLAEVSRRNMIEQQWRQCSDMLADFPGEMLPDKLSILIGEWLAFRVRASIEETLGIQHIEVAAVSVGNPGARNGANGMHPGDRVVYTIDSRRGVAKEFLQDGDAYVLFDGDKCTTQVKWNNLQPDRRPHLPRRGFPPVLKREVMPKGYCPAGATGGDGVVFRVGDLCNWVNPRGQELVVRVASVGADGTALVAYPGLRGPAPIVKWEALCLCERAQT